MRISNQLLRSRATRPLYSAELIDLSHLDLVSVDRLELCPKLQTLILRENRIEAVPNLDCCPQLWKIDLANNKLRSLEGLSQFPAFGTLILSNNELNWNELQKIRHMHILDLTLHGNPLLEMDAYYRHHVIDSLPHVWMLDGRIITSAERAQVHQFFKDTALCDRPVRHKLPRNQFVPSCLKNIKVTGIHGVRMDHLMRHFPHKTTLNIDLDKRRLHYLAYNLQQDVNLDLKYATREKVKPSSLIENLISCRQNDKERCNMLLLLLVGSLEFSIPLSLVQQTLEVARLKIIGKVKTMDFFMFARETRCRIVSLLLSAVKIERDQNIDGGLYNRLYLSLYDLVSDLVRLANGDDIARYQAIRKRFDTRKSGYRCLLASEIVQLLCIVPVFFDFIGKDPGVMDLIRVATKNPDVGEQIKSISWKIQAEGDKANKVYQEITRFLLLKTKEASSTVANPGKGKSSEVLEENECPLYIIEPSYIITSKRLIKPSSQEKPRPSTGPPRQSTGPTRSSTGPTRQSPTRPSTGPPRPSTVTEVCKSSVRSIRTVAARPKTSKRKPRLGDRVRIGHQACGRLVALPENHVGLVQIDNMAASRFQQADYNLHSKFDHQFYYVNFKNMEWDPKVTQWRSVSGLLGNHSSKNGKNKKSANENEEESMFLSEVLQQSLKLRTDLTFTQNQTDDENDDDADFNSGHILITDHVRSIVRECLEEAEVQWLEDRSPLIPDRPQSEQSWTEPERESPAIHSEVTVQIDSNSFTASHDLCDAESTEQSATLDLGDAEITEQSAILDVGDGESTEQSAILDVGDAESTEHHLASHDVGDADSTEQGEIRQQWTVSDRTDVAIPRSAQIKNFMRVSDLVEVNMYKPENKYHKPMDHSREEETEEIPDSLHVEEMISMTENARLEAWRSYEVMKRDASSCFTSRIGSANSRPVTAHATNTPPQRPCRPLRPNPITIKRADCWLAGGKDVSGIRVRRLTPPMPGWMEGLRDVRRPKSSPIVGNARRFSAHTKRPRTGITVSQPTGGAASVRVSGQPPPSYTRAKSAKVVVHKR